MTDSVPGLVPDTFHLNGIYDSPGLDPFGTMAKTLVGKTFQARNLEGSPDWDGVIVTAYQVPENGNLALVIRRDGTDELIDVVIESNVVIEEES